MYLLSNFKKKKGKEQEHMSLRQIAYPQRHTGGTMG